MIRIHIYLKSLLPHAFSSEIPNVVYPSLQIPVDLTESANFIDNHNKSALFMKLIF